MIPFLSEGEEKDDWFTPRYFHYVYYTCVPVLIILHIIACLRAADNGIKNIEYPWTIISTGIFMVVYAVHKLARVQGDTMNNEDHPDQRRLPCVLWTHENYDISCMPYSCILTYFVWISISTIVIIGTMWCTELNGIFQQFLYVYNALCFSIMVVFEQHHQRKKYRNNLSSRIIVFQWIFLVFVLASYFYRTISAI